MFLLGQVVTAQPLLWIFGERTASLKLYGALATIVWFSCVTVVGRRCVDERRTLLLVVVIACWPGMGLLASSFMTDMPFVAASLLSLAVGIAAIRRQSRVLIVGCLLAGLLGFTIREQAIVSVVAVTAGAWVSNRSSRRFRVELTSGAAALLALCAAMERLRHQMANADVPPFGFDTLDFHLLPPSLLPCLFTVGLAVSPLALWSLGTLRREQLTDPGRIAGWLLGLVALGAVARSNYANFPTVILGITSTISGSFPSAVIGNPTRVIDSSSWLLLQMLAMIGGICILGEACARLRRIRSLWQGWRTADPAALIMTVYTLLLVAFVVGLAFGGQRQYDRYLIALFPGAGLLLLQPARISTVLSKRTAIFGGMVGASIVFLAVISMAVMISVNVRDAAVWNAASALRARGIRATSINAGFDWNGYHATRPMDRRALRGKRDEYLGHHWIRRFPSSEDCYVVSVSEMSEAKWRLLAQAQHGPYGTDGGSITTYTYQKKACSLGENR